MSVADGRSLLLNLELICLPWLVEYEEDSPISFLPFLFFLLFTISVIHYCILIELTCNTHLAVPISPRQNVIVTTVGV